MNLKKISALLLSLALILGIAMPGTLAMEASQDEPATEASEPTEETSEETTEETSLSPSEPEEPSDGGEEEPTSPEEPTEAEDQPTEDAALPAPFGIASPASTLAAGDTIWIKSGSLTYKQPDATSEKRSVLFNYQTKVLSAVTDADGVLWCEFEVTGLLQMFPEYKYVPATSTTTEEPSKEWTIEDKTFTASEKVLIRKTDESKQSRILEHFDLEEGRKAYFVDIDGSDGVETTISVAGMLNTNTHKNVMVLHLLDSADAIRNAISAGGVAWNYFTVSDTSRFEAEVAAAKEATGADNRVYYVTLDAEIETDGTISFCTDSFSTFLYIVTFEYEGNTCELSGGGTMYLSDLIKELNLSQSVADVTDVRFSDPTVVTAEASQGDWIIRSEESFHTEELMTLTFSDGSSLTIKLTDPTVMYCVSHTARLNTSGTETHTINRSGASNNPYKSNAVVNKTSITVDNVTSAADSDSTTKDLVIYAAPGMAIRFTTGIGFPDGSWSIEKSNSGNYKHGNWEWVWSGNTNYILLNDTITQSTYVDFNVTADSKTCQVRIWIIPNPTNNEVSKVHDTVKDSDTYEVRSIPVTLYDYEGTTWNQYWNTTNGGYWYAFHGSSGGKTAETGLTLSWTGGHLPNSGNLSQGVFQNELDENNLPVFTSTAQTDLFGKTSSEAMGKTVYNDVGFEFIYEKSSGFYTYSSNLNHAQYNQEKNTIELYDQTLSAMTGNTNANSVAGFYPFQDIHQAIPNWGYNGSGWQGNLTQDYSTRYWGEYAWDVVASTDEKATINMHFGIQIEADFYMPTDKKSQIDGTDLIFEFTGDDDLWVFMDDQLVLDLGGAHTPVSGSINFTKETVTVDSYYPVTASGNSYSEVSANNGKQTFTFEQLGIQVSVDQMHTLRVFYLERWSGESNCRMRFNLPLAPENSVLVNKKLTNQDGDSLSVTPDVEYTFQVYTALSDSKKDDVLNEDETAFKPLANTMYYILGYESNKLYTDAEGKFNLKPGQTAVFEGIPRFTEVYAVELQPTDGYVYTAPLVSVNKEAAKSYSYGNATDKKIVKLSSNITFDFINRMQTVPLTFTKEVVNGTDGLIDKEQKFEFDLEFTKPILEKGQAIQANNGKTVTDGAAFQLSTGESITIPRVPVNMTFSFGERNPDATYHSFDAPKYESTIVACKQTPNAFQEYDWTVKNGGENKITVTNQQRFALTIVKNGISELDHGSGENPDELQSTLYVVVGTAGGKTLYKGTVAICGNDSITIKDLPVGNYTVTEVTDWSWRYEAEGGAEKTPVIQHETTVTYTNNRKNPYWLSGDNYCKNDWSDWSKKKDSTADAG